MIKRLAKRAKKEKSLESYEMCDVEHVLGAKWTGSEMVFSIKWKSLQHNTTYEPIFNVANCIIFREFINDKFKALENEIYINIEKIKEKQKKERRALLISQSKAATLYQILPFDPFEFKIIQTCYHLVKKDKSLTQELEKLVFKNFFFKLDEKQRQLGDELLERIHKKEDVPVTIENDEDFDSPPIFSYINRNILTDSEYKIEQTTLKGCKCRDCSVESNCCPQLFGEQFPYRNNKSGNAVMRFGNQKKIYECGDLCSCGPNCLNRLTQRPKTVPFCLFKTKDRGWGLKAMSDVPKGTFIIEYVGELIGQDETNSRSVSTYFFDLNSDGVSDSDYHTIDALNYGNLARFINHSCQPNSRMWFINNCYGDPRNKKLCLFAMRDIQKGEEITIDYSGETIKNVDKNIECNCGSSNCRKLLY